MPKIIDVIPGLKPTKGDIGVEIEVEGSSLPLGTMTWRRERDNSLRGEESGEYVLNKPVPYEELTEVFNELKQSFIDSGARVDKTYRAGTHVHVNVQQLSIIELFNFITIFLILEECIVDFCEESRRGNHFCMRAKDAGYLSAVLWKCVERGNLKQMDDENIRYSAMNLSSLFKYGSVEFRCLESTDDFSRIQTWCDIIYTLKESCKQFKDPIDVMSNVSMGGYEQFVNVVMKHNSKYIFNSADWKNKVKEGIRQAQDIAFSRVWGAVNLDIFAQNREDF